MKKGQEFGYFAFGTSALFMPASSNLIYSCVGGSTIIVPFEKGKVTWDEDLLLNGRAALETLVRVGMGIGWGRVEA